MFLLAVFVLWAVSRLLLSGGPRHMHGYDLIRSSEASWHQWNGKGSYIYLSVYFLNRGNWYYYRTEDPTIRPNDIVVVPWGRNNRQELAIVGWVEQRTAADVPYPLSRTRMMIQKAGNEYRYAFDEGIRWPKKVNVSERWCREERGKAFHVHNDRDERKKLKAWIGENPRLMAFEPMSELDLERRRFMHR